MTTPAPAPVPKPAGPYSSWYRAGDFVFVAGQVPRDAERRVIGDTIEAQTAAVFDRLNAVLADAGARLDQVVQMRVYLADMVGEMARFNTAYVDAMGAHRPVRTTVGCELNGVKVEIDAVAYLGTDVSSSR